MNAFKVRTYATPQKVNWSDTSRRDTVCAKEKQYNNTHLIGPF